MKLGGKLSKSSILASYILVDLRCRNLRVDVLVTTFYKISVNLVITLSTSSFFWDIDYQF